MAVRRLTVLPIRTRTAIPLQNRRPQAAAELPEITAPIRTPRTVKTASSRPTRTPTAAAAIPMPTATRASPARNKNYKDQHQNTAKTTPAADYIKTSAAGFKSAPCITGCKMDLENIRELGSRDFALIQSLKLWKGRKSNERKHEN